VLTKKAFTLIELLVVIAIIAILAAILFPVFAQAKLAAKKTGSISNQKQLILGEKMYENDYDDTIVVSQYCSTYGNGNTLQTWEQSLYPYIKSGDTQSNITYGIGNGSPARDVASGIFSDPAAPDNQSFPYGIHRNLAVDNWGESCNGSKTANGAPNVIPGSNTSVIPDPVDLAFIFLKGRSADIGGWIYFDADEYAWASTVGPEVNGTYPQEVDNLAIEYGNCDSQGNLTTWADWAPSCGMLPRYRYTNTCPMAFEDGHAKAIAYGQLKFTKNIYVAGLAMNTAGQLW